MNTAKAIRRAKMIAGSVKAAKRKHYDVGGVSDGSADGGDGTGGQAAAAGYGVGNANGYGSQGNAAGEAAGIGASTAGTGSFGNGFGNAAGNSTDGMGSVSGLGGAPAGGVASVGLGGIGGVSTAGVTGGVGSDSNGGGQYGGTPGPSAYGNTTNSYGSNVSQPGGANTNSITSLNSVNQNALNQAAALSSTISPQLKAALVNGTAGSVYGDTPAQIAALMHEAGLTGISGETVSPGGIYGIGDANMGAPAAGISFGPGGYGTATSLGNSIGAASIGTGPNSPGVSPDSTVYGPNEGEAIANEASPAAIAAAHALDAKMGFGVGNNAAALNALQADVKRGTVSQANAVNDANALGLQALNSPSPDQTTPVTTMQDLVAQQMQRGIGLGADVGGYGFGAGIQGFSATNAPSQQASNMSAGVNTGTNNGFVAPGTNSSPAPSSGNSTSGGFGNHQVQERVVGHGGHARGGRALRADGGKSLSDAIGQFSKDRTASFTRPPAMDASQYAANNNYGMQSPHLMMAELPQARTESRLGSMTGDAGDLGQTFQNIHDDVWGKKANVNSGAGANAGNSSVGNGGGPNRSGNPSSTDNLSGLMANIAKTESGGWKNPYEALGPVVKSGDRAYGKYQVMGANVPSWTKEILGQPMTPAQFMANPDAQEAVASAKLGQYMKQYGTPEDAASMWFSGRPLAQGANLSDGNMTGGEYAARATSGLRTPPQQVAAPIPAQPQQNTPAPQASMDQGDQSNLYNRVAMMPGVQSGYQTPQALFAPDQPQAARGGYIKRAGGGPATGGMPSFMGNPLVMQALNYINKNGLGQQGNAGVNEVSGMRRGGRLHFAGGGGHGNFDQPPSGAWSPTNTYGMSYAENQQNDVAAAENEVNAQKMGLPGAGYVFEGNYPGVDPSLTGGILGNFGGSSSSAAPSGVPYTPPPPPQTYTPPLDGSGGSSSAAGPKYNNTLDQVLGTNSPTMQQMFGFNYPNIPPPQPLPFASPDNGAAAAFEQFTGTAPTGGAPTLNNPPEISPGVLPPLIASGTVGNYSQFNPNPLSASQIPMAQAARGGSIQHALNVARRAKARG